MQSTAATVADYIAALPDDRRHIVETVRQVILANLDGGYAESMQYGMIGYAVPHSLFPAGYHCDPTLPLPFAAIASQKNHVSVYLMGLYCGCGSDEELTDDVQWFRDAWAASGKKKLDMGDRAYPRPTLHGALPAGTGRDTENKPQKSRVSPGGVNRNLSAGSVPRTPLRSRAAALPAT